MKSRCTGVSLLSHLNIMLVMMVVMLVIVMLLVMFMMIIVMTWLMNCDRVIDVFKQYGGLMMTSLAEMAETMLMTMVEKSFMMLLLLLLLLLLMLLLLVLLLVTKYLSGTSVFFHCSAFTLNLELDS